MDDQVTFRIPRRLSRLLDQLAKAQGVRKSQVVREALQAYFLRQETAAPSTAADRYIGAVALDRAAAERDALAALIRRHNWR